MKNNIILGSANFNYKYGIKKNFIKKQKINGLLNLAYKNKIKKIDTAPVYNNSEKIVGFLNKNRFKIISKIPKKPRNIKNIKKWMEKIVSTSLKNLKVTQLECLMIHDVTELLSKNGHEIYQNINRMKERGFAKKIGISIYDFEITDKILKKFEFDLIQVPINIFDQRLIDKGWLEKFKRKKMEVHARSIFLQGLLLLKYNQIPKKLRKYKKNWIKWQNWLKKNRITALEACLSFIFRLKSLDGVVIGCDSEKQLNQILQFKKIKKNFKTKTLNIKDKGLIDPRNWIN